VESLGYPERVRGVGTSVAATWTSMSRGPLVERFVTHNSVYPKGAVSLFFFRRQEQDAITKVAFQSTQDIDF